MTGAEARFEFRIWADRLDDVRARLLSLAGSVESRESAETYFVSTATIDANPKARADLLDIKVLAGVAEGFEQWGVRLKAEFPIDAELLRTEFFPLLCLTPPLLERAEYSLAQLSGEVAAPGTNLAAVAVAKRRQIGMIGSCIAEAADVTIAGRELQTAAVESVDLGDLRDVRRALSMEGHDNVNYPRAIRGVLGGPFALRHRED